MTENNIDFLKKPLIESSEEILTIFGLKCSFVEEQVAKELCSKKSINVLIGLTSDVKGTIVFQAEQELVFKIVSAMCNGASVTNLDEMGQSALCEFMNMLCGTAVNKVADEYFIDISTPTLIYGTTLNINLNHNPVLHLFFELEKEKFVIAYSLHSKK